MLLKLNLIHLILKPDFSRNFHNLINFIRGVLFPPRCNEIAEREVGEKLSYLCAAICAAIKQSLIIPHTREI